MPMKSQRQVVFWSWKAIHSMIHNECLVSSGSLAAQTRAAGVSLICQFPVSAIAQVSSGSG